jgi:hypothetical protein
VVDVLARPREIPVPAMERPLAVPIVPILLLKVFQSVDVRAPVVDVLASARESSCPERERPLALPRVRAA